MQWQMRPGRVLLCTLDAEESRTWEADSCSMIDELAKTAWESKVCVLEVRPLGGQAQRLYVAWEVMYPKLPECLVDAMKEEEPVFALECVWRYKIASPEGRLDMASFYDSGGPNMVRQVRLRAEQGVPTSEDLRRAMEGERPANRCPRCDADAVTKIARIEGGKLIKVLQCPLGHSTREDV